MTATHLLVGLLLAASAAVLLYRSGPARRRLHDLALAARPATAKKRRSLVRLTAVLVGLVVVLLVPGWLGLVVGAVAGYLADRAIRRLEPADVRRAREHARADLPYAVDLLAAVLASGAPPAIAAAEVGAALGAPLGTHLDSAGRALALGAAPSDAWQVLHVAPGGDRVAAAMVRGSESGAALAGSLRRLADDLRSSQLTSLEAATQRAGVLVVLPLGLCFLPAFIASGLVPVVLSMLGSAMP